METQRRRCIEIAVAMVDRVHSPQQRPAVHRDMLQPDGEVEDDEGENALIATTASR